MAKNIKTRRRLFPIREGNINIVSLGKCDDSECWHLVDGEDHEHAVTAIGGRASGDDILEAEAMLRGAGYVGQMEVSYMTRRQYRKMYGYVLG